MCATLSRPCRSSRHSPLVLYARNSDRKYWGSGLTELHFSAALLPDGWAKSVRVRVESGRIAGVTRDAPGVGSGVAVPGLANLHSHGFQRAMAGLTETAGPATDSFWSW